MLHGHGGVGEVGERRGERLLLLVVVQQRLLLLLLLLLLLGVLLLVVGGEGVLGEEALLVVERVGGEGLGGDDELGLGGHVLVLDGDVCNGPRRGRVVGGGVGVEVVLGGLLVVEEGLGGGVEVDVLAVVAHVRERRPPVHHALLLLLVVGGVGVVEGEGLLVVCVGRVYVGVVVELLEQRGLEDADVVLLVVRAMEKVQVCRRRGARCAACAIHPWSKVPPSFHNRLYISPSTQNYI